ncbi:hypothetical protein GCM10025868_42800 [Angustibacter aerolatus]|uniref:Uncharacterized protein n=1 Tax=Angustibacter aerolatus TaxID=1162965 RepID=A0ABQ6JP39_9ACTN|nr:hypothetical protein GCM10025868_42800 [Angustibacter aerolatus]
MLVVDEGVEVAGVLVGAVLVAVAVGPVSAAVRVAAGAVAVGTPPVAVDVEGVAGAVAVPLASAPPAGRTTSARAAVVASAARRVRGWDRPDMVASRAAVGRRPAARPTGRAPTGLRP